MKKPRKGIPSRISEESPGALEKKEELVNSLLSDDRVEVLKKAPSSAGKAPKAEKVITKRVTIDIPLDFHKQMKAHTKSQGQTIKGYLLYLAREDLNKRS